MDSKVNEALEVATLYRERAYAPYSKFKVGAALFLDDDTTILGGCNVENASFGACICAERNCFLNMKVNYPKAKANFIVLITDTDPVAAPCGMCRQTMAEFVKSDFKIYLANLKGIQKEVTLGEILPMAFTSLD